MSTPLYDLFNAAANSAYPHYESADRPHDWETVRRQNRHYWDGVTDVLFMAKRIIDASTNEDNEMLQVLVENLREGRYIGNVAANTEVRRRRERWWRRF